MFGNNGLARYDAYEAWIENNQKTFNQNYIEPHSKYVENSQWILVDLETKRVLGLVNIRHYLSDYLLHQGGHIGYSIRPLERRKGYGHIALKLALEEMKSMGIHRVLVTCDDDNIPSIKTAESCDGKLGNTVVTADNLLRRRYWINN